MSKHPKPSDPAVRLLLRDLAAAIPDERLLRDPLSTFAHGCDASFYQLVPQLVVKVLDEKEASTTLAACARHGVPVTIRAAGTSLSGQAVTDSVLLLVSRTFNRARVLDQGRRIRLEPAVLGSAANRLLAPFGRKIGPDPASIDAAMIGGIAANNASGMCCGIAHNSYRTLDSMRLVLADGAVLDTADPASRAAFAESHRTLLDGLSRLADQVQADAELRDLIHRKYRMKNTTGYSLNALADFRDPIDILQHLLIGSEGTLGFISEITLRTVPDPPCKAAVLAFFSDDASAGMAVLALAAYTEGADRGRTPDGGGPQEAEIPPVAAVEFMDAASLRAVASYPEIAAAGNIAGCSALLIDVRARNHDDLGDRLDAVRDILTVMPHRVPPLVATQASAYRSLWALRKGLFPAIGSRRPPGTTALIEDVAFPMDRLSEALTDLRELLDAFGYGHAILYGHALSGNLHFVFWQDFNRPDETDRYAAFLESLAELVVGKYQGSLKAEHGTGRNMAPFVEMEWGRRAYDLMLDIKSLFDPLGVLNPDVVLSTDNRIHVKNLKPLPLAHPVVDRCTECGFCENACPSKNLTLTPRQRIAAWREITRLREAAHSDRNPGRLKALTRSFVHQGEETCATDGLCARNCPVGIDTGSLIKAIRRDSKPAWQRALASVAAGRFALILRGLRLFLHLHHAARATLGERSWTRLWMAASRFAPVFFPPGAGHLPRPASKLISLRVPPMHAAPIQSRPQVLYFPSCINRAFGPGRKEDPSLPEAMVTLMQRAGFDPLLPEGLDSLCCGLAFASKGFEAQGESKVQELQAALEARMHGRMGPVAILCDASPCSQRLKEKLSKSLRVQDSVEFLAQQVLPRLDFRKIPGPVALHPTCSLNKMGLDGNLADLASACSETVVLPEGMSCCGVAGDKIFTHPDLVQSACAPLRSSLPTGCRDGYSSSRTCEIGLSAASGLPYRSIAYLLLESSAEGKAPILNQEKILQTKDAP